jgi:hypothetical protein
MKELVIAPTVATYALNLAAARKVSHDFGASPSDGNRSNTHAICIALNHLRLCQIKVMIYIGIRDLLP